MDKYSENTFFFFLQLRRLENEKSAGAGTSSLSYKSGMLDAGMQMPSYD